MYSDGRIVLFCGDAREVLQHPVVGQVSVVVTDPPYAAWKYLQDMRESKKLELSHDIEWQSNIFQWVTEWYWMMHHHLADGAVSWLFCNVDYLGFYLRWARLAGWTHTTILPLADDEFLLYSAQAPLRAADEADVRQALQLNAYGHGKSVDMLRVLMQASPAGHVLDPFAGEGTTLLAARAEGRTATGIEIVEESCAKLATALRQPAA